MPHERFRVSVSFSHGLCPECLPNYFSAQDQPIEQGEGEKPPS